MSPATEPASCDSQDHSRPIGARSATPLILGVGNVLMGDEGIGSVAVRHLEQTGLGGHAELVDGGTGGFHLLGLLLSYAHVILLDAAADGKPAGTVSLISPKFASDFPPTLTAHDIGLRDLIESATLLGKLPHVDLITISIGDLSSMTLELSAPVRAALPQVAALVCQCLGENNGVAPENRPPARKAHTLE